MSADDDFLPKGLFDEPDNTDAALVQRAFRIWDQLGGRLDFVNVPFQPPPSGPTARDDFLIGMAVGYFATVRVWSENCELRGEIIRRPKDVPPEWNVS